jgi:hypothetical protein
LQRTAEIWSRKNTEIKREIVQSPFDFIVSDVLDGKASASLTRAGFGESWKEEALDESRAGAYAECLLLG